VSQAISYAAFLKSSGVYGLFAATVNARQLALFATDENTEELVDWDAVSKRDYGRVTKDFYEFKNDNLILHGLHGQFQKSF